MAEGPDEDKGMLSVTRNQVSTFVLLGGGVTAMVGVVASAVFLYAGISNSVDKQKEDLGRVWQVISDQHNESRKTDDLLTGSLESLRNLYNVQESRIQALSDNYRIIETNLGTISANLVAATREYTAKIDAVLTKQEDLGVGLARLEAAVKYIDGSNRSKSEGHQ